MTAQLAAKKDRERTILINIPVHGQKEERKLNIGTIWVSDKWVSAGLSIEQPHAVLHMEKTESSYLLQFSGMVLTVKYAKWYCANYFWVLNLTVHHQDSGPCI